LASGCGTGSLADTLVRVPLLSRESVATGPTWDIHLLYPSPTISSQLLAWFQSASS
jgi:hypothetical protein